MARAKKPSTTGDLIRSLVVILVPLIVITVIFTRGPSEPPVKVVDWQPVLAAARKQSPYPVLAPVALPDTWRSTKVSWAQAGGPGANGGRSVGNVWELGFLNPEDRFVAVGQTDQKVDDFVQQQTRSGAADGESTVGTKVWRRVVSADDRTRSLVFSDPKVTTVVSGDVEYGVLEDFAGTLRSS